MKKFNIIAIIVTCLFLTNFAVASDSFPAFPMSLWGNVSINNSAAPINSVIKAYYGNVLAGELTTTESGKYGDDTATGSKLLILEGSGVISFTLTTATGVQYAGVTYPNGFISGQTVNYNLNFSTGGGSSSSSSSSGGGGGGGGYALGAYGLPVTYSSTDRDLTDRAIQLPTAGETAGIFTANISVKHSKTGIVTSFSQKTKVTKSDGSVYVGTIATPNRVLPGKLPKSLPLNAQVVLAFDIGNEEHIFFDQPVLIEVPLAEDEVGNANLVVYFFNENTEEYEQIENVTLSADGKKLIISVDHFSLFVVIDNNEKETMPNNNDSNENNTKSDQRFFNDLADHWAESYVNVLFEKGIVQGKSASVYSPKLSVTRAEFIKMVLLAKGSQVSATITESSFIDVEIDKWYAPYTEKAKELEILNGYKDGSFKPSREISRAEALKVLFIAKGDKIESQTGDIFEDIEKASWYFDIVNMAYDQNIVTGREIAGKKVFLPHDPISRAEAAKIIVKAFEF